MALAAGVLAASLGLAGWWWAQELEAKGSAVTAAQPAPTGSLAASPPSEPATWDVGAPPSSIAAPPASPSPHRTVQGDVWQFTLPEGWYPIVAETPHVLTRFASSEMIEGYRPNVALVSEPWRGDLYGYAGQLVNRDYEDGRLLLVGRHPFIIDGHAGEMVEAVFELADPPYQMVATLIVDGQRAVLLTCSGPRSAFTKVRKTCQQITRSLRVGGRGARSGATE